MITNPVPVLLCAPNSLNPALYTNTELAHALMMGGGAGGRGMGGADDENAKDSWLVEDDDVWGIGDPDEDPYA